MVDLSLTDELLKILSEKKSSNKTRLQYMCKKHPSLKSKLRHIINDHLNKMDNEELVVYEKMIGAHLDHSEIKFPHACLKVGLFKNKYVQINMYEELLTTIERRIHENLDEITRKRNARVPV